MSATAIAAHDGDRVMTEELDDEKRIWYLKGYAQAEADRKIKTVTQYIRLHLKAHNFANKCREEVIENRKPLTHGELEVTWLNHYEGFLAGYKDALENKE